MLNDKLIEYVGGGKSNDTISEDKGVALVWVIDGDCLYDIPIWQAHFDMFMNYDEVIDISDQYPEHDGTTVRFIKNGEIIDELQTSEYFGSILLSNPTVLNLADYPYGRYVQSPHAKFDGEKFILTNRDMTDLLKWSPSHPRASEN